MPEWGAETRPSLTVALGDSSFPAWPFFAGRGLWHGDKDFHLDSVRSKGGS